MFKKAKEFKKRLVEYYKEEENKKVAIFYTVLRFLVILCLIREIFIGNYHNVFLCLLTLVLFVIPFFIEDKFQVTIPNVLEIIILLFIFSAEILGEIQNFYNIIPNWDTILHTLNGFLAAAIGFSLIDILNRTDKVHIALSPIFVALVAFCFSMTVGVVWEFFEYTADSLLSTDMQKDTIINKISCVNLTNTNAFDPEIIKDINKTNQNILQVENNKVKAEAKKENIEEKIDILCNNMWEEYEITYASACSNYKNINLSFEDLKKQENNIKSKISKLGNVNVGAIEEYKIVKERYDFNIQQREDIFCLLYTSDAADEL